MIGPKVLVKLDTDWPIPCTVPKTDGCGEQLLIRIVAHGSAKVRANTWINRTPVIAAHMNMPVTPAGGLDQLGTILRKGTNVYVIGNNMRERR
jgi:hypothetical protein